MNKRQREVEEAKLAREKKILETLKQQYQRAAKDIAEKTRLHTEKIDALLSEWDSLDEKQKSVLRSQIYQRNYQLMLRRQIDCVLDQLNRGQYDRISQYLKECHEMAQVGTLYDLHGQNIPLMLPVQLEDAVKAAELDAEVSGKLYGSYVTELKQHIRAELTRGISAGLSYGELARNLNGIATIGLNKAMRIVRTEGHRIQQEGQFQAQHQAKEAGADIVKQWDSTLDGRTRPTHRKLDGQIRELNEPFEAEGKKAMYPGDFGRPEEDINCRCTLLQRANWALDEDELKTLQKRAAYFGLDKTKDFEEFRAKYLKASVEKSASADIMKESRIFEELNLEQFQRMKGKISASERKVVYGRSHFSGYIASSEAKYINADIRTGKALSEKRKEVAEILQNVISQNTIDRDILVYRYVGDNAFFSITGVKMPKATLKMTSAEFFERINALPAQIPAGRTYIEKAFLSTSGVMDKNVMNDRGTLLRIRCPAGTHGYVTTNKRESEIIFGQNTTLRILGASITGSGTAQVKVVLDCIIE